MWRKYAFLIGLALLVTLWTPSIAIAQTGGIFSVTGSTVGGGSTSAGGSYGLVGAIGQPDTGVMSGGVFSLSGGVLSGLFVYRAYLPKIIR